MVWLYIFSSDQLCNIYLISEQYALGWCFLIMAFCIILYFVQTLFYNESEYEEKSLFKMHNSKSNNESCILDRL